MQCTATANSNPFSEFECTSVFLTVFKMAWISVYGIFKGNPIILYTFFNEFNSWDSVRREDRGSPETLSASNVGSNVLKVLLQSLFHLVIFPSLQLSMFSIMLFSICSSSPSKYLSGKAEYSSFSFYDLRLLNLLERFSFLAWRAFCQTLGSSMIYHLN